MSEHYNQNYTKEEVDVILKKIKDCVNDNRYMISKNENRKDNMQFRFIKGTSQLIIVLGNRLKF